jgi:hypothetical protein
MAITQNTSLSSIPLFFERKELPNPLSKMKLVPMEHEFYSPTAN